jgi:hypothetical protein
MNYPAIRNEGGAVLAKQQYNATTSINHLSSRGSHLLQSLRQSVDIGQKQLHKIAQFFDFVKVRDPRFGEVNSYYESMLDAALLKLHGGM